MYLASVSVRRTEDIAEALGVVKPLLIISEPNKKVYSTLKICAAILCKVGVIRMSMWMGFTYATTGAKVLKI